MIIVTIVTKNFRFLFTINEILSNIAEVRTNHILPNEPIPDNTEVIITTETEKGLIKGKKVFVPKALNRYYLYSNIYLKSQKNQIFNSTVIGIDPGKTTGLAIVAEENIIIGTGEYFTAVDVVKEVISAFFNIETKEFAIKIGAGGGDIRDEIVKRLKGIFHDKSTINVVKEDHTSKDNIKLGSSKFSKNIKSAILIAKRKR